MIFQRKRRKKREENCQLFITSTSHKFSLEMMNSRSADSKSQFSISNVYMLRFALCNEKWINWKLMRCDMLWCVISNSLDRLKYMYFIKLLRYNRRMFARFMRFAIRYWMPMDLFGMNGLECVRICTTPFIRLRREQSVRQRINDVNRYSIIKQSANQPTKQPSNEHHKNENQRL